MRLEEIALIHHHRFRSFFRLVKLNLHEEIEEDEKEILHQLMRSVNHPLECILNKQLFASYCTMEHQQDRMKIANNTKQIL